VTCPKTTPIIINFRMPLAAKMAKAMDADDIAVKSTLRVVAGHHKHPF
jgi:hypothetical protein